jgi:hypothetical protein
MIMEETSPTNTYVLLNNGDLYYTGRSTPFGTRNNTVITTFSFIGPIANNVKNFASSGGSDGVLYIHKLDNTVYVSSNAGGKILDINTYSYTFHPLMLNSQLLYINNIIGNSLTAYSAMGAIDFDGKLYLTGSLNSLYNGLGCLTINAAIYSLRIFEFYEPVTDIRFFNNVDGANYFGGSVLQLANGKLYGCGYNKYLGTSSSVTSWVPLNY